MLLLASTGEHTNPLIPHANEIIWASISFGLFFLLMAKFVFPSMNKMLKERTASIEGKMEQAERDRLEAQNLLASYQQKLKDASTEAVQIVEQARSNADRLETELRAQAQDKAQTIVDRAQETINAERDRAMETLRHDVGGLAVDLAERVVGESLDRDRQLRLVDQYINDLSSKGKAK